MPGAACISDLSMEPIEGLCPPRIGVMSIFDAHLLDQGWPTPRCVQVCPTGALAAIHDSDEALRALAAREDLQPLRPDLDTRPRVLYRNLPRIRSVFLSGNVVAALPDGRKINAEGATVSLVAGGTALKSTTDAFGDFKFDGLARGGSDYRLHVAHDGHGSAERSGRLLDSVHLGAIELR